ncbi:hypothetical protein HY487_01745 [Candidatus Woesearchaeota archaeon]|nr:hypothetical protein [Candidatus Woesearchaeota archaeon]
MKGRKEKKRWGLILFIIFIMIGTSVSFVFFGFSGASELVKYNGIKFVHYPDRWEAKISGKTAAFSFLPNEVEDIPFKDASRLMGRLEIDVTYDLNSTYKGAIALAHHQMGLTLSQYNIFVRKGSASNNTFNLPVITCDDATQNVPVIYFRQENLTSIDASGNCLIAEADTNENFIRMKDRILYGILGVIK